MLFRDPAFTVAAAVVLALGMGASTAIFTLVHAVLLAPLPYPDSARLVYVWTARLESGTGTDILSAEDFREFRTKIVSFEKTAGYIRNSFVVTGVGQPQRLSVMNVTDDFFETLGIRPALGREFRADEFHAGRDTEAIFSNEFWRDRLAGDPGAIGRRITLDGMSYEIVGVMPAGFPLSGDFDMWAPLAVESPLAQGRLHPTMRAFGRLKPGVPLERAQAEVTALAADFAARYPEDRYKTFKLTTFLDFEVGDTRESLWILAAAVACLLLIACSNVASLLLARGAGRVREMAVRAAVGASRAALIRQMLVESTALAILGGVLGMALAAGSVRVLLTMAPDALPRSREIHADPRILAFGFVLSLATGILCGIVPAWRGSRVNLNEALKEAGRGGAGIRGNRLHAALVVAEVAFAVALMACAGLLARSLRSLNEVRLGYDTRGTVVMQVALPLARYGKNLEEARRFFERVVRGIEELPGVEAAGSTNLLPLQTDTNRVGVWVDTQPVESQETRIVLDNRVLTPGYFRAMGVPLIAGRFFDWTDRPETPRVVIINDAFAREAFPNGALGHRITLDLGKPWTAEVVGVVASFRESSLWEEPRRELFTTESQTTIRGQTLVVKTGEKATGGNAAGSEGFLNIASGTPASGTITADTVAAVRRVIAQVDSDVPVYNVRTMQQNVSNQLAQPRMRGMVFGAFSVVALVLASLGVYGVIACAVAERKQEIGIRMALGARPAQVRGMLAAEGLKLTAIGLAIGLAGAAAAGRLMARFLYGISAADPWSFLGSFLGAAAVFAAVALAASYLPSRKAVKLDPLRVLKSE
jgi:predicted permease